MESNTPGNWGLYQVGTTLLTIDPDTFADRMEKRWKEFGNISSVPLRLSWVQVGKTLNLFILNHDHPVKSRNWSVLPPPTGSGKTQCIIVYCWMLSEMPGQEHPGVLIVVRLKADADIIAQQINTLTGREVAVSFHSDSETDPGELKGWPVLVITNSAYVRALSFISQGMAPLSRWLHFISWAGEGRKLVVIDEAIDLVEDIQVTAEKLRLTLAALPQVVKAKHAHEVSVIESIIEILTDEDFETSETMIFKEQMALIQSSHREDVVGKTPDGHDIVRFNIGFRQIPDFSALRKQLRFLRFDHQIEKDDLRENDRLTKLHDSRLARLGMILTRWAYYARVDSERTLCTSRLLIPSRFKGAVVLDAAASANPIYELFEEASILEPPPGSRLYGNVSLHVSRDHKVGKEFMRKHAKEVSANLIADLNVRLSGRDVFIVCHKDVEPILKTHNPTFRMRLGHWGKITGSNEWRDCDTVVLFGLPYLPDSWTATTFMAYRGPQDTEWLRARDERAFGKHQDIRRALKSGQILTELIQAVNRIRCRKVIDTEGNCPLTDVYILLPLGALADEILRGIELQMPGVRILDDWVFESQKRKAKRSMYKDGLIAYLQNMGPGGLPVSHVRKELGASPKTMKRLVRAIKEPDSDLRKALAEMGVVYEVVPVGKTSKAYFVKRGNLEGVT